jgi:hypothetical protein
MAITYDWTIPTCEHDIATGGINVVHWRCTASETVGEDTYTATSYGTVGLIPDPSSPISFPTPTSLRTKQSFGSGGKLTKSKPNLLSLQTSRTRRTPRKPAAPRGNLNLKGDYDGRETNKNHHYQR